MRLFKLMLTVVVIALLAGVAPIHATPPAPWPTKEWATSTPEEQGMDSAALSEFIEQVPKLGSVDSLMVVRNGYVVAEVYWHPFQKGRQHELHSTSKSILSILVGIALDKGYLKSLDQKVLDFFPGVEVKNLDDNKRAMTIRDLLTQKSGFRCEFVDGTGGDDVFLSPSGTQLGLDWPMASKPGTIWHYCTINAYLLSAILTKVTGMDALAFAKQNLFAPMGITDADWMKSLEGLDAGAFGLWLNTSDMAKIGYLFLNNGQWADRQIVATNWVTASIQTYTKRPYDVPSAGYGYLWWTYDTPFGKFYEASGSYFQQIMVSTEKNLVAVVTGIDDNLNISNFSDPQFMKSIVEAVKSEAPLPPSSSGAARLKAAVNAAANPLVTAPKPLPKLATQLTGQMYRLETADMLLPEPYPDMFRRPDADWQVTALGLDFGSDQATLHLQLKSGTEVNVAVGLDDVYRVTATNIGTLAAKGKWETETRFDFFLRTLEETRLLNYTLTFSDGRVDGSVMPAEPDTSPGIDSLKPIKGQVVK